MPVFRTNDYGGNGLASGLSQGMALAQMLDEKKRRQGLASGLANYIGAGDDEQLKNTALQEMAKADPNATARFVGIDDNDYGSSVSGVALQIVQSPEKYTPEQVDWAKNHLQYSVKNPEYMRGSSYGSEIGKGQAQLQYKPILAQQTKTAEKGVELEYNPQIRSAEKKAETKAEMEQSQELVQGMLPVVDTALKRVEDNFKLSTDGIGPVQGRTPWTSSAGAKNRQDVSEAQKQMNIATRGLLKSMGIQSREMDAGREAEKYQYVVRQDMQPEEISRVVELFRQDMLNGVLKKKIQEDYGVTQKQNVNVTKQKTNMPSPEEASAELRRRGEL